MLTPPANVLPPVCAAPVGSSRPCFGLSRSVFCESNCISSGFLAFFAVCSVPLTRKLRSSLKVNSRVDLHSIQIVLTHASGEPHRASRVSLCDTRRSQRHYVRCRVIRHPGMLAYDEQ